MSGFSLESFCIFKVILKMKNIIIGQSGGPTRVINQSLIGAVREALGSDDIGKVLGMRHGVLGIFNEDFVDFREYSDEQLGVIAETPASALGSCRHKPAEEDCGRIFEVFQKHEINYWFYIGGNDTAETVHIVSEIAKEKNYDLKAFHIPKTIDNDLRVTDHCPGYASAARYVAECFLGNDLDNRALNGVKIDIVMGRGAGWLTAASALARDAEFCFEKHSIDKGAVRLRRALAGPHLIYLPEAPKSLDDVVAEIDEVYERLGRCVVAVSEGIRDKDGELLAKKFSKEVDSHGNIQLSGSGALGDMLAEYVKSHSKHEGLRVRTDTLGYAQRSFPAVVSEVDSQEAEMVGAAAVRFALEGRESGGVYIDRIANDPYESQAGLTELKNVAKVTKDMPAEFVAENGHDVTDAFLEYVKPIVGEVTRVGVL